MVRKNGYKKYIWVLLHTLMKYLREYGDEYRELSKKSDDKSKELLNQVESVQ